MFRLVSRSYKHPGYALAVPLSTIWRLSRVAWGPALPETPSETEGHKRVFQEPHGHERCQGACQPSGGLSCCAQGGAPLMDEISLHAQDPDLDQD